MLKPWNIPTVTVLVDIAQGHLPILSPYVFSSRQAIHTSIKRPIRGIEPPVTLLDKI
jgi:hypothetical protein